MNLSILTNQLIDVASSNTSDQGAEMANRSIMNAEQTKHDRTMLRQAFDVCCIVYSVISIVAFCWLYVPGAPWGKSTSGRSKESPLAEPSLVNSSIWLRQTC